MPRNNHIIAWIYNIYKVANNRNHLRHLDKQGGLHYRGSVSLLFLWQGKAGMQADFNCALEIQALSGPIFYIFPLVYVSVACLSLSLSLFSLAFQLFLSFWCLLQSLTCSDSVLPSFHCFSGARVRNMTTDASWIYLLQVQTPKFPGKGLLTSPPLN